ncbi:hypothetical protein Cgig2_032283 [Carnegiea gigantea]|uniref:Uncharacterized protein n=1 Tax=Carnegiea gigantea TaxID=171969 RepID=A0A9Q1GR43_9CARY|nr:hypothetical protein Cgig2_032283 [Carnegiea gigantea]
MWSPRMGALPFISSISAHREFLTMAFPYSLSTSEMARYVARNFEWERRGVSFPPLPLPNDFLALCSSYEHAMAKEAAQCFHFSKLPQVIFYAMLLRKLRAPLRHRRGRTEIESWRPGSEKRLSKRRRARMPWGPPPLPGETVRKGKKKREREREREGAFLTPFILAFPPLNDTREMADFMRKSFRWHWRSNTCPPRSLPDDYQDLRSHFVLSDAERATLDFEATFYAMLLNDAIEAGTMSGPMAVDLKLTLEGLRWASCESLLSYNSYGLMKRNFISKPCQKEPAGYKRETTEVIERGERRLTSFPTFLDTMQVAEYSLREFSALRPKLLPLNFHGLCTNFVLLVAMQFAHTAHILEMVQAIFYTVVLNEAAELRLLSRAAMHRTMLDLWELKWDIIEDIYERLKDIQVPALSRYSLILNYRYAFVPPSSVVCYTYITQPCLHLAHQVGISQRNRPIPIWRVVIPSSLASQPLLMAWWWRTSP